MIGCEKNMTYRECKISSERNRSDLLLLNIQFQLQGLQPGPHSRRSVLDVWPERDRPDERNLHIEIWREKENVWPYCQFLDNRNTNLLICSSSSSIQLQAGDNFRVLLVRGCLGVDGGQYLSFLGHRLAPSIPWYVLLYCFQIQILKGGSKKKQLCWT